MRSLEYGDEEVGAKEIMFAVPSMVIGIGILFLPRSLANETNFYDGAVSLLIGGFLAVFFTWVNAKLASKFPGKPLFSFVPLLVPKPVVFVLKMILTVHAMILAAYEVRMIAEIAKQYLFDQTPVEVLSVLFLLVVVYAVSGSRVGILRLNILFLPIIYCVALAISFLNIAYFDYHNLFPVLTTDWNGYVAGIKQSFFSMQGFAILLFYIALMNKPKEAPKAAVKGMGMVILLYLVLFTTCIGVFSNDSTSTMVFPTIELAKEIQVPGGFFERFESLFFTIWIMAIFNTAAMSLDMTVISLRSMFKKLKKKNAIIIISPMVYLICMYPQSFIEIMGFGKIISYSGVLVAIILPSILLIIAKIRRIGDS